MESGPRLRKRERELLEKEGVRVLEYRDECGYPLDGVVNFVETMLMDRMPRIVLWQRITTNQLTNKQVTHYYSHFFNVYVQVLHL